MAAPIFFDSNAIVNGTTGNDTLIGNDPLGNTNDIIYGHQGDDSVGTINGLFDSTFYGGQGNDTIQTFASSRNVIYGNLGNDIILANNDTGDTSYGGQGNDSFGQVFTQNSTIYGNLGNDEIDGFGNRFANYYGGRDDDSVFDARSSNDVIYGNVGNDLLDGNDGTINTHEYGGQGNDTLVFTGANTDNDVETGNLGNDVFVATNGTGGETISVFEIVTVTDFLQGSDQLAEGHQLNVPLVKIAGMGDNAQQALTAADNVYSTTPGNPSEYVFVYGGTGAGYLFYNGDSSAGQNQSFATSGMAILGASGENSVNASDITTIPNNVPIA